MKALQAGHDLLLKPRDAWAMIRGIVEAVKAGQVSEAHINQAVQKLLCWKARLRLPAQSMGGRVSRLMLPSELRSTGPWRRKLQTGP